MMQKRFIRIAKPTAILLAIGFTYLLIHELTGFSLRCPIYQLFGVYCPGCGVGRMCFHLAHGEIAQAFLSNCVVFCMLPLLLGVAVFHAVRYVRFGDKKMYRIEKIGAWVLVSILLVFAVARNIFPIDILIP